MDRAQSRLSATSTSGSSALDKELLSQREQQTEDEAGAQRGIQKPPRCLFPVLKLSLFFFFFPVPFLYSLSEFPKEKGHRSASNHSH